MIGGSAPLGLRGRPQSDCFYIADSGFPSFHTVCERRFVVADLYSHPGSQRCWAAARSAATVEHGMVAGWGGIALAGGCTLISISSPFPGALHLTTGHKLDVSSGRDLGGTGLVHLAMGLSSLAFGPGVEEAGEGWPDLVACWATERFGGLRL